MGRGSDGYSILLYGKVKMPGKMKYSFEEYGRKIRDRIDREYRGFHPDNGIVDLLCNLTWLGCEMLEMKKESPQAFYEAIRGRVAVPDRMKCTLAEFARKIANRLLIENRADVPDADFIELLHNAAWLGLEQIELMEGES